MCQKTGKAAHTECFPLANQLIVLNALAVLVRYCHCCCLLLLLVVVVVVVVVVAFDVCLCVCWSLCGSVSIIDLPNSGEQHLIC